MRPHKKTLWFNLAPKCDYRSANACGHANFFNKKAYLCMKYTRLTQAQAISLYQPILQRIAVRMVRSKADAEDIVQETFIKWLLQEQEKIKNTKAYLIKAVTNNCINHRSEERRVGKEW